MRSVTFVSRFEFDFKGNLAKNAISLGDVDNDNDYELAVGNLQGDLAIFKGERCQPWLEAHDFGMVMVLLIGDILNEGKNSLVCISSEGLCSILQVQNENSLDSERKVLHTFHVQRLPANTKVALLADVDNDGELELVLGLTDHVLRTYRWVRISQNSDDCTGKLVGLHKLELADQIGSISLNPSPDGTPYILVAQAGGTYINFKCSLDKEEDLEAEMGESKLTTPVHHPLATKRMRNKNISSEILGGISGTFNNKSSDSLIAVATLDGTFMLVDGDEILWSHQVDHHLFAISKLDLNSDGEDEIIVCAWDGQTYMVNLQKESVRFQFEEHVSTFTSGKYSVTPGTSVPVLVYATFSDKVFLYYDIHLASFGISTLTQKADDSLEMSSLLTQLPVDLTERKHLRRLLSSCLYEVPVKLKEFVDEEGISNE